MKNLKLLFITLFVLLVIPVNVYADNVTKSDSDNKDLPLKKEVNIYFFRGDGCGFCEEGLQWFESIEKKYGDKFDLYTYETWNDEKNAELMDDVIKKRKENISGVPYIIIGDKSWNGFSHEFTDEILETIKKEYSIKPEERYDIMSILGIFPDDIPEKEKDDYKDDIVVSILLIGILSGIGFGIYKIRLMN